VFRDVHFRSPHVLAALAPVPGTVRSAVQFDKDAEPEAAVAREYDGAARELDTGAFVIGCWPRP
jgi:hypothetical protein